MFYFYSERQAKYKTDVQELNQYLVSDEKLDTPEDYPSELSLEDGLKDCVKHHEMIQVFNESLEDYFRWFLISKFCFSSKFNMLIGKVALTCHLICFQLFLFAFWLMLYRQWKNSQ